MDKRDLLNELLDLGGSHRLEASKVLEPKLIDYIENIEADPQIEDALRILKMQRVEYFENDLVTGCRLVEPVFERLMNMEEWGIYDILLAAIVAGHAKTYRQTYLFAEDILGRLEKYSNERWYVGTLLAIHVNVVSRLVRARFFDLENFDELGELGNMFLQHTNAGLALCNEKIYFMQKAMFMIRKGLFYGDDDLVKEGFTLLSDNGELGMYKGMRYEVKQFEYLAELTITRKQYDIIIGNSIRELRLDRDITTEELAELLDVSSWSLGQFERGERGISGLIIRQLADIFGVSTDVFYNGPQSIPLELNYHEKQLQILLAYARKLTEDETDYLLTNIKSLLKLNRGEKRNRFG